MGILALATACSSSSSRFGPFTQTAAINPGSSYPSAPRAGKVRGSKPFYTASIKKNNKTNRYGYGGSRRVESAPLPPVRRQPAQFSPRPLTPRAPGKIVTVAPGDTAYGISRRNGVTVADLAATNGLVAPYTLRTGQRLRIPAGGLRINPAISAAPKKPRAKRVARVHRVQPGETLYALSRRYGVSPRTIASNNALPAPYIIKPGQVVRIPASGARRVAVAPARKPIPDYKSPTTKVIPARATPRKPVATIPVPRAKGAKVATKTDLRARPAKAASKAHRGALPRPDPRSSSKFRWPVKGKVISKFGRKKGGARNDGINISVPAGTSVRAADNGVVAYAGNELRGYGNLVLIRHTGGWVTAYAHNGELFVRRGVKVRRGQIIAKAGKTGAVTRPQLHFEIRKGAEAVDPLKHMTSSYFAGG